MADSEPTPAQEQRPAQTPSSPLPRKRAPIMDVAHPNKSAPSGNSKSVIVTHRPMMQDPMVNTEAVEPKAPPSTAPILSDSSKQAKESNAHEGLKLEPMSEPEETSPEPKLEQQPAPEKQPAPEQPLAPEQPPSSTEEPAEAVDTTEAEAPQDQGDKGTAVETTPDAINEEQAKADAELQKLIDSKKYFLPINTLENRRSQRFVAIGILLSLIMIVAWADIALDAGLISIDGVKALTNFF